MASREIVKAQRDRLTLLAALGGKCAACGTKENLTFDCIAPRGDHHHRLSSAARVRFYWNEARRGNVQVLCFNCNVRKSDGAAVPFGVTVPQCSCGTISVIFKGGPSGRS